MPVTTMPPTRLPAIPEDRLTPAQRALIDSIRSGPRGQFKMSGPFYCYLHAPAFGELAQKLGAHCRFGTSLPPRLSEFAILATAQRWKSQYEWAAHAPIADLVFRDGRFEVLQEGVLGGRFHFAVRSHSLSGMRTQAKGHK